MSAPACISVRSLKGARARVSGARVSGARVSGRSRVSVASTSSHPSRPSLLSLRGLSPAVQRRRRAVVGGGDGKWAEVGAASRRGSVRARASGNGQEKVPFGYTRKDVFIICAAFLAVGYGTYYGALALGNDDIGATRWVLIVIVLGGMIGWCASYVGRVATKEMTYVKQLDDYENAVMAKRLEEMSEAERDALLDEVESDKESTPTRNQ